jgi:hypothetical protein
MKPFRKAKGRYLMQQGLQNRKEKEDHGKDDPVLSKLRVAHKHSFDLPVLRDLSYRSLPLSTIKVALAS